ncbi:hypothetical protein [Legionella parisiensis]|uniref:Uncharacterized protein n=1 Tax=Legionella parisiensis TaxID=45071 RepID=A0A1E5JS11_9GAMM|nr:hypothetical protein [Legionella parisiensis]KTD41080.1 hypothetical protein Lpar_2397 [Legionella parisiensis]OEH47302.1 hypothetical protein lpari_01784 [Legionella parisiensis]STX76625.1 Uncharacterised protein [Legionella parisiensis]
MSREKLHQEIAEILQKKMQEKGIKCEWIADANGIVGRVDEEAYKAKEQILKGIFGRNVARNLSHNLEEPVFYKVDYQSPAKLIELLNTLGETDKAIEYQKAIDQENNEIAAKLNQLMKEEHVQWTASIDRVFCTHIQKIDDDAYRTIGRDAGEDAFRDNLKFYGVTVSPKISTALGIEGRADKHLGLVKVEASFSWGEALQELNTQVDKALVSGVTRHKTSITTNKVETVDTTSQFKDRLGGIKQEQVNYSEICDKIAKFCAQYPNVDGLKEMQKLGIRRAAHSTGEIASKALNKAIELAEWKKSDSDFTKGFHHKMRGRVPEVEEFYQQLAKLNPEDPSSVEQFKSFVDRELDIKHEQSGNYRYS